MTPNAASSTNMKKSDGFQSCCSAQHDIIWSNELRHLARHATDYKEDSVSCGLHPHWFLTPILPCPTCKAKLSWQELLGAKSCKMRKWLRNDLLIVQ